MADNKKLHPVDLFGIGNLLEYAVAEKSITCEQRDESLSGSLMKMVLKIIPSQFLQVTCAAQMK